MIFMPILPSRKVDLLTTVMSDEARSCFDQLATLYSDYWCGWLLHFSTAALFDLSILGIFRAEKNQKFPVISCRGVLGTATFYFAACVGKLHFVRTNSWIRIAPNLEFVRLKQATRLFRKNITARTQNLLSHKLTYVHNLKKNYE